jgi:hypothetical protein
MTPAKNGNRSRKSRFLYSRYFGTAGTLVSSREWKQETSDLVIPSASDIAETRLIADREGSPPKLQNVRDWRAFPDQLADIDRYGFDYGTVFKASRELQNVTAVRKV